MNIGNYILLKIEIQKLTERLDILGSNYNYQVPITFHDQFVMTQLFSDLRTLQMVVSFIEQNLKDDAVIGIPKPLREDS